jgi:DNA repair protein RadC
MVVVDTRHRVIASEILFAGTIDGSRVYPREVVKCALRHNAAAGCWITQVRMTAQMQLF